MRLLIGCSAALALVVFMIGFVVSLFVRDASWLDQLTLAGMPAIITFAAALFLFSRDSAKHAATMRSVRNSLLSHPDTNDDLFLSPRSFDNTGLLLQTRTAIARFFDVPPEKIARTVRLIDDLHVDKLEPSFQFFVVESVIARQNIEPKPFTFSMAGLDTIDRLAMAIQDVLDGFNQFPDNDTRDA
jgi:hypothetical protein